MVVKLRYGVRDDGSAPKDTAEIALHASGDKANYSFFMDRTRSVTLEYQVVVTYKAGFAIGSNDTTATSDWIPTTTRNLDIDPRTVAGVFPVSLVLGNVDWHNVQSVQTTVLYDGGGQHSERTVVLSQASPAAVVPIRPPAGGTRAFHVRSIFFYGAIQEVVELDGQDTATVVINPPTTRAVPVSLTATDPLGRFRKVTVELSYAPPGQPEQTSMVELPGDGASAAWTFFRPDDRADSSYRYRVTLFGRDGTTQTSDWQTTPERQLIVGDRFEGLISVDVQFLVADFTQAGYMGARLRLEYPEAPPTVKATVEKFFTGQPQPFNWRMPRPHGASSQYRYTVQWVRANATTQDVGPSDDRSGTAAAVSADRNLNADPPGTGRCSDAVFLSDGAAAGDREDLRAVAPTRACTSAPTRAMPARRSRRRSASRSRRCSRCACRRRCRWPAACRTRRAPRCRRRGRCGRFSGCGRRPTRASTTKRKSGG